MPNSAFNEYRAGLALAVGPVQVGADGRGPALTLTVVAILPDGTGGCTVVLDVDGVMGQADEDDRLEYITVPGAPVAAAGNMRYPRNTITMGLPAGLAVGTDEETQNVWNSEGGITEMTAASLTAGLVWRVFEPTLGTWASVTPMAAHDEGTGELTWTFPAAFARGHLYRYEIDMYQSAESESVSGYIHRMSFAQGDPDERYDYGYMGAARTTAFANVGASGPVVHGTDDLTGGHDWAAASQDFWISRSGVADGVPFADTTVEGSRSSIGAKADSPYLESSTWTWD